MLLAVCWLLFNVLFYNVCCLLSVVWYLSCGHCSLSLVLDSFLSIVYCVLFVVGCLFCDVNC